MFRTWRFDVEGKLKVGRNELHIVFASPTLKGREEMERYGLRLPADNDQSVRVAMGDDRVSVYTRKGSLPLWLGLGASFGDFRHLASGDFGGLE